MGVKDFTKVFENSGEFKYKEFAGKNVVIDASVELYRAALGMKRSEQLTNSFGVPTSHINTILLGVILKLKAAGANQYWVFDYRPDSSEKQEYHNPLKQLELKKRKEKRDLAKAKLDELNKTLTNLSVSKKKKPPTSLKTSDDNLFSDESSDDQNDQDKEELVNCRRDIDKQEKVAFSMEQFYMEDTLFLLNSLDIPWMECPPGFEAEQICALSTNNKDIFGKKMHYVFSPDSDALIFGARKLIKRDTRKKKLFKYDLNELLTTYDLTQEDLIKIAIILKCDFAPKTPRIGIKTVLKKYKDVILTDVQQDAYQIFTKKLTDDEIANIDVKNADVNSFTDEVKYKQLLDWIELVKGYNRERIVKQFQKQELFMNIE